MLTPVDEFLEYSLLISFTKSSVVTVLKLNIDPDIFSFIAEILGWY